MANWKKVIVSGSNAELNSVTGSFTGSFKGTIDADIASSSVSVLAQTASVALRVNSLAPTVTATSASVAARATTLSAAATASYALLASDARTATSASIATSAGTASVAVRANSLAPTATATSASTAVLAQTSSVSLRANALSPLATASIADFATSASHAATGDGIFSGSFSGSYQGDGSALTGLATTLTVDGDSGTQDVSLTADDLQILGTAQEITTAVTKAGNDVKVTLSLPDNVTIGNNLTVANDATIAGDLVVGGSIVSASSLAVADQFIILASGSNGAIDGGIIINQVNDNPDGKGVALAFDSSANRWALQTGLNDTASVIVPDAHLGVIQEASGVPSSVPTYGGTAGKGTIYVNTGNDDIFIYS